MSIGTSSEARQHSCGMESTESGSSNPSEKIISLLRNLFLAARLPAGGGPDATARKDANLTFCQTSTPDVIMTSAPSDALFFIRVIHSESKRNIIDVVERCVANVGNTLEHANGRYLISRVE